MRFINVDGLPEHVVHALETIIDALRLNYQSKSDRKKERITELPRVPGKVIGSLSRKDIYDDIG